MDAALDGSEVAKAGLEMALFDIVGKALGTPVHTLLGGITRERVPLSFSIPFGDPGAMADLAAERVAQGFGAVKVKVGRDPETDVAAVARVRQAVGPAVELRVDANMAWQSPKRAVAMIRRLEPYDLEFVEQPLPPRDLDGMAFVRARASVPVMADESVWTPADTIEVIRREAADAVNVYVSESGGLANAARSFAICEAAGIPCMIGSMPELGIGTAAQIHLGVAVTRLGFASDACGALYYAEDLLREPLEIAGGFAYPPSRPGLGVEVDWKVVKRWQIE
jgi:muconate cycloisomerase